MGLEAFRFSKEHEWVKPDGDIATVGITNYAQKELGDVVYVELPAIGNEVQKGDSCSSIESVKAVSDIYAPVAGEIIEVNEILEEKPEVVNQDPHGSGWIFKIKMKDPNEIQGLMAEAKYKEYLEGISGE